MDHRTEFFGRKKTDSSEEHGEDEEEEEKMIRGQEEKLVALLMCQNRHSKEKCWSSLRYTTYYHRTLFMRKTMAKKKRIRSLILSLNNHSSSLHQKNLLFRNILCIWPCRQPFFFFSEYHCLRLVYVLLFEPDSSKWQQRVS